MKAVPFAPLRLAEPAVTLDARADGTTIVRSPHPLPEHPPHLGDLLIAQAARFPDRPLLAAPDGTRWRTVTYREAAAAVEAIAQALLDRGLAPERPLMVLSGNGIDHGLLMLAAYRCGVPIAPVSPAYSLMSADQARVRAIVEQVRPGLVYAEDGERFRAALERVDGAAQIVISRNPPAGIRTTRFETLLAAKPGSAVAEAAAGIQPDSVAKYLFTSGSTGAPKGVVNTHRMLASNQAMIAAMWPFLSDAPPVLVDWLPWNHTFGGNHNFNMVLWHGGTLYIDPGRPLPGEFDATLDSLRQRAPTVYFNVPAGYDMLVPALERDAPLRERFFSRLDLLFYAAASLTPDLWARLERLAVRETGRRVVMLSAWGATETAPCATAVYWPIEQAGVIGLPQPGVSLKLVPAGEKTEVRVKGPNVTPGYLGRPDLTAAAFDDEGYYRIGDAVRFADPDEPRRGLMFDGRVAESFKLTSGTWVHAGPLRVAAIDALSPLVRDAVVAAPDRDRVALLAWPNLDACREAAGAGVEPGDPDAVLRSPGVVERVREGLARYNAAHPASSTRIARVMLMREPPSIDAGEITDKGYINQGIALERRHLLVARLYREPLDEDVIEA